MSELKPCPFCGGEQVFTAEGEDGWVHSEHSCDFVECESFPTEAEAVTAWNTRTADGFSDNRTCYNKKEAYTRFFGYYFVCSECGWNIPDVGNDGIELAVALMKSCPMCGAEIVKE